MPPPAAESASSVWVWSIVLLGFLLVAFIVIAFVRRKMSPNEDFHGDGFTLSDLRAMHAAGQMSDAEFEKAKSLIVNVAKANIDKQAEAKRAAAVRKLPDEPVDLG